MFLLMIDGLKSKFAQEIFANFVILLIYVPKFDIFFSKIIQNSSSVFQNMFWTVFHINCAQHSPLSLCPGDPLGEQSVSTQIFLSVSEKKNLFNVLTKESATHPRLDAFVGAA